ncbi:MAG: hypothetical protein Q8P30_01900 [Candidatus Uhrbacteria bacterium]|nr:hypothetical protein [Candidatus Uhrbacteria bacterium]
MIDATDILYIVLAFCALWVTAFICWFIYQIAVVLKNVNDVLSEVKFQIERVEQALNGIKSKFDAGTGHLGSLADDIKRAASKWKGTK